MLQTRDKLKERYEIVSVLGEGGMGFVYLALDGRLGGKKVAVKEMAVHIRRSDEKQRALEQFREEAHLLAALEHPQLVQVTDFFELGEKAYLVMAYIDGKTLDEVTQERAVPMVEVLDWITQITDVLAYLHGQAPPVLFRDLKPSNVMLDGRGKIRLIDFGIARTLDAGQSTNTFLKGAGTAEFAPVEQFGGKGTDARSDIYSLGATMYNLLTGVLPPISVDIISGEAEMIAPRQHNPAIPVGVEQVILKAMSLRKEDRFQSVSELRVNLEVAVSATAPALAAPSAAGMPTVLPDAAPTASRSLATAGAPSPSSTDVAPPSGTKSWGPRTTADLPQVSGNTAPLPSASGGTALLSGGAPIVVPSLRVGAPAPAAQWPKIVAAVVAVVLLTAAGLFATGWRPFGAHGRLRVTTTPPGSIVTLDGNGKGQSPVTLAGMRAGPHVLEVMKDGLEGQVINFSVEADGKIKVRPGYEGDELREEGTAPPLLALRLHPQQGTLVMNVTPEGGEVLIDGKLAASRVMQGTRVPIEVGSRKVVVQAQGYKPLVRTVQIGWKEQIELSQTLQAATGTLTVTTGQPGSVVSLNGRRIGIAPVKEELKPGLYSVRVEKPGFKVYEKSVQVVSGRNDVVPVELVAVARKAQPTQPRIVEVPAPIPTGERGIPGSGRPRGTGGGDGPAVAGGGGTTVGDEQSGERYPRYVMKMRQALEMAHSHPHKVPYLSMMLEQKLREEGLPNVEQKMPTLKSYMERASTMPKREFWAHRERMAHQMAVVAAQH